jgi:hypothetical protein
MVRVFICYRRRDGHCAGTVAEHLTSAVGNGSVFRDIDALRAGADWQQGILSSIASSDVFLSLIGTDWIGNAADSTSRISNPGDTLRREIEYAIERQIPIVPVLVDDALLPGEAKLPGSIRGILSLQCERIRDSDFRSDVQRLCVAVQAFEGRRNYSIPVPRPGEPITPHTWL